MVSFLVLSLPLVDAVDAFPSVLEVRAVDHGVLGGLGDAGDVGLVELG